MLVLFVIETKRITIFTFSAIIGWRHCGRCCRFAFSFTNVWTEEFDFFPCNFIIFLASFFRLSRNPFSTILPFCIIEMESIAILAFSTVIGWWQRCGRIALSSTNCWTKEADICPCNKILFLASFGRLFQNPFSTILLFCVIETELFAILTSSSGIRW
jgi:hypothetical protein